ncbi:hypothetical protein [Muriicola soli]|uniref:Uncharacterized protein n=1 Tax=Muriicola soli TaxID=2507538 RepID=A0A411E7A1_9FLAO|nr:hypothetical protein [Muriicola soli]QBA63586.1 hypothetical protein EQY75_02890 [Muriicola soli]
MSPKSKSLILFILFLWLVFAAWEMDVQSTINTYPESIVRLDLLLLPFLIILTVFVVYILIRKNDFDGAQDSDLHQDV